MFSKVNDRGHFGIKKIIIGETGMKNAVNDYMGIYGMTQDSFGIVVESADEATGVLNTVTSDRFITLIKNACSWSNFRIDWRLFKNFKRNFYEEFENII